MVGEAEEGIYPHDSAATVMWIVHQMVKKVAKCRRKKIFGF